MVSVTSSVIAPTIQDLDVTPGLAAYWLIAGIAVLVFLYNLK
ncbi:hypothetical protein [Paracoccus liaowanqingii]|nr:hypothetical protein [Paracoccus liaowanqingii]